jgi:hypothetical protein
MESYFACDYVTWNWNRMDRHFKQACHVVRYSNAFTNLTAEIVYLMFIIDQFSTALYAFFAWYTWPECRLYMGHYVCVERNKSVYPDDVPVQQYIQEIYLEPAVWYGLHHLGFIILLRCQAFRLNTCTKIFSQTHWCFIVIWKQIFQNSSYLTNSFYTKK